MITTMVELMVAGAARRILRDEWDKPMLSIEKGEVMSAAREVWFETLARAGEWEKWVVVRSVQHQRGAWCS